MNFLKISLVISLFCIMSCKKDPESPEPPGPPVPKKVAVKVQNLDSLKKYNIRHFYFLAFDTAGRQIAAFYQNADSIKFGQITDSLFPGKYTVVTIGSPDSLYLNERDKYYSWEPWPLATARIRYGPGAPWTDVADIKEVFYRKTNLTVHGDTTISDISLNRIVGKVEVILEDSSVFDDINVYYIFESDYYSIGPDTLSKPFDWTINTVGKMPFDKISKGRHQRFIANNKEPFTIYIEGRRNQWGLTTKQLTGVRCYWDKTTTVKGKVGTYPTGNSVVNVTLNAEWSGDTTITF